MKLFRRKVRDHFLEGALVSTFSDVLFRSLSLLTIVFRNNFFSHLMKSSLNYHKPVRGLCYISSPLNFKDDKILLKIFEL